MPFVIVDSSSKILLYAILFEDSANAEGYIARNHIVNGIALHLAYADADYRLKVDNVKTDNYTPIMTQEELYKRACEVAKNTEEYSYSSTIDAYETGYQDAQSEVKDTAIAFAEWVNTEELYRGSGGSWYEHLPVVSIIANSTSELYDLFLASQNKQP